MWLGTQGARYLWDVPGMLVVRGAGRRPLCLGVALLLTAQTLHTLVLTCSRLFCIVALGYYCFEYALALSLRHAQ